MKKINVTDITLKKLSQDREVALFQGEDRNCSMC